MGNGGIIRRKISFIPVYSSDKRISRQKPDGSRQKTVNSAGQETVTEEEETRNETCDM